MGKGKRGKDREEGDEEGGRENKKSDCCKSQIIILYMCGLLQLTLFYGAGVYS